MTDNMLCPACRSEGKPGEYGYVCPEELCRVQFYKAGETRFPGWKN